MYAPSDNAVAGFLTSVIVDDEGESLGLIAFQIPIDNIDAIMRESTGLGATGETYLVGADLVMRSNSSREEHRDHSDKASGHGGNSGVARGPYHEGK